MQPLTISYIKKLIQYKETLSIENNDKGFKVIEEDLDMPLGEFVLDNFSSEEQLQAFLKGFLFGKHGEIDNTLNLEVN